jgi:hypothetical protein
VTVTSQTNPVQKASLEITVSASPQILSQTLPSGSVGVPYSQTIALNGGTPPFQWSVYNGPIGTGFRVGGSVPDGLTLNAGTGRISGTPTAGGTWYFEATVTDAAGITAVNGFMSIRVNASVAPANPIPFLNQTLNPAAVSPGGPGFILSVSGAGFVSGAIVDLNGVPLPTTFVDGEHLTANVSAAEIATAGTASVTVVNPAPGGGRSNSVYLQLGAQETLVNFVNAPGTPLTNLEPFALAAADFNEDGKPDLAIASDARVFTFLGHGDGTFAPAPGSPVRVPSPPYNGSSTPINVAVAVGDFDHSGHLGLAASEFSNEAAVILLGNGDGSFLPSSAGFAQVLGYGVGPVGAADFNADGNLDLAIMRDSSETSVFLGYGRGAFNAAGVLQNSMGIPLGGTSFVVGDFNADGKLDVIVTTAVSAAAPAPGVAVSLGNGDGKFTAASGSPISLGKSLSAIVAGDFNGDGKLDIAITDVSGNAVWVLLGNGDGTFGAPAAIPVGNQPEAIIAGDFNNDGKLDLAVANYGEGTITLLLGKGDGTFTQASGSPYPVGRGPSALAAADFNGDGKLDLAVANSLDGTVSVLLQQ